MIESLRVVICLALTAGAGAAFLRALGVSEDREQRGSSQMGSSQGTRSGRLGWSFLAGAALIGTLLHVPLAIDGTIQHGWFAAVFALSVLATAWFAWTVLRDRRATGGSSRGARFWIFDLPGPLWILIVLIVASVVWFNVAAPLTTYDSRAIYGLKARVLYDVGSVRGEDFLDIARAHYHPQYPLLLPLNEAYLYWAQGSVGEAALKWLGAAFSLALVGAFVDEVRRRTSALAAALWGLGLLVTPLVLSPTEGGGLSGSADVLLAAFALGAFVQLGRWLEEPRWQTAALAGLFLGAAVLTKQEGLLLVAGAGAALAYVGVRQRIRIKAAGEIVLVAGGVAVACWLVSAAARRGLTESPFVRDYAMAMRADWLGQLWRRPAELLPYVFLQFFNTSTWNLAWPLLAVALFLRRPVPSATVRLWRSGLALVACAYCVIFWITPYNLQFQMSTALNRLALHLFPLAMLVLAEHLFASRFTADIVAAFSSARSPARASR